MTRGLKVAAGLLFERRLICDERGGQALRGGTGGGTKDLAAKGCNWGASKWLVGHSGRMVHLPTQIVVRLASQYAREMSAIRTSPWAAGGRRFWHGLWYGHGVGPCWKLPPRQLYMDCG
jgi:hypothetical protein